MRGVLIEEMAASAATPPVVLVHLARTADPGAARVLRSLATNRALPVEAARLVLRCGRADVVAALMRRRTAQQVVQLLAGAPLALLKSALANTPDPDDVLVRYACEVTGSVPVRALALSCASTVAGTRVAALALASCPRTTAKHHSALQRVLAFDPAIAPELLTVANPGARQELLAFQEARASASRKVGSAAWMQHADTTVEQILDWAHANDSAASWAHVVRYAHDAEGRLARAALAAQPDGAETLRLIVGNARNDEQVRQDAAIALLRVRAQVTGAAHNSVGLMVTRGSVEFAVRFAEHVYDSRDLTFLSDRDDLPAGAVENIAAAVAGGIAEDRLDNRVVLHQRPVWGAWLATYPTAPLEVRMLGLDWAHSWSHSSINHVLRGGRTDAARALLSSCVNFAELGVDLAGEPAAVVGARLLVADLQVTQGPRTVPGVRRMLRAALDARWADLPAQVDPVAVSLAVDALQGSFPGTVAELWDTALTIAS